MTPDRETLETRDLTQRTLLLDIRTRVGEIEGHLHQLNGTVASLHTEIHGDQDRQIIGIKPQVVDAAAYITAQRTGTKVLQWIIGVLGAANIAALTVVAAKVF